MYYPFYNKLMYIIVISSSIRVSKLSLITSKTCICPGKEAIFQCSVTNSSTTVWQGTALRECWGDNVIVLRHSQFGSGHVINKTCGPIGEVIGESVSIDNDSSIAPVYVSRLTINFSENLYNKTIECACC